MNREQFIELTKEKPFIVDGATGSNLILAGMPRGISSEEWVYNHPDVIKKLQKDYVKAGSQAVYAPTFSANRLSLRNMGIEDMTRVLNSELPGFSREAVGDGILVAGDMTTVGKTMEPYGPISQNELFEAYAEQAKLLYEAGVDFIVGETLLYKEEAMLMLDAISSVCDLATVITFTVEGDGTLPFSGNVIDVVEEIEAMGAAAVGVNCSMGPDQAVSVVRAIKEKVSIPVVAKLNAGMPEISDEGIAVYSMDASSFAKNMMVLVEAGARVVGGCCGTTPEYIKALHDAIEARF